MQNNKGLMIDLHSHILPHVDDGPKTVEDSARLVSLQLADGIQKAAATPHFNPSKDHYESFLEIRASAARALRNFLQDCGIDFEIRLGAEVAFHPALISLKDKSGLCLEGTNFMLIELQDNIWPLWGDDTLYQLRLQGITPIFAHVEKYPCFCKQPQKLYELVTTGVYAQTNSRSILPGSCYRRQVYKLMQHRLIHFIATDSHSVEKRPPMSSAALEQIRKDFGEDAVEQFRNNASDFFSGYEPQAEEPLPVKKRWTDFLHGSF